MRELLIVVLFLVLVLLLVVLLAWWATVGIESLDVEDEPWK